MGAATRFFSDDEREVLHPESRPNPSPATVAVVEPLGRTERIRLLATRWREDGDTRARDQLLALHQGLIHGFVRRYPARVGIEDLTQEAQLGFLRALETFDPDRGVELATYARHWIRAYVHRYLLRSWSVVARFTTHEKRRVFFGAGNARRSLGLSAGEDEETLATHLNVRLETLREVEQSRRSLDEGLEGGEDQTQERFASQGPGPEGEAARNETARLVRERLPEALAALDERERMIFLSRFDPDEAVSLEELGSRLGVTRERARQLETRARKKLAASFADLVDADLARQAQIAPPRRGFRARSPAAA